MVGPTSCRERPGALWMVAALSAGLESANWLTWKSPASFKHYKLWFSGSTFKRGRSRGKDPVDGVIGKMCDRLCQSFPKGIWSACSVWHKTQRGQSCFKHTHGHRGVLSHFMNNSCTWTSILTAYSNKTWHSVSPHSRERILLNLIMSDNRGSSYNFYLLFLPENNQTLLLECTISPKALLPRRPILKFWAFPRLCFPLALFGKFQILQGVLGQWTLKSELYFLFIFTWLRLNSQAS